VINRSYTQRTVKIPIEMSTGLKFVKVKVKVKFTLEKATKVQSGSRGTALLFL